MSLQSTFPSGIPEQTREIGEVILDPDDVCYFLGNHIEEFLSEADFAEMYSSIGRGGVHPLILSMVTVLQYLEKLPDRRASQQVVKRLDWKYALHQSLIWTGFHYSDLCNFRKRLLENNASSLVFDKLIEHLRAKGWLKSGGKQRTDATHILGEVKRLSLLELKWESLRMALVDLMSHDAKWVWSNLSEDFSETYASSRNTYRMSQAKQKELEKQLERDMLTLLDLIATHGDQEWLNLRYVKLLHRVAREQLEYVDLSEFPDWQDSSLDWEFPQGRIQSPHDPDARYGQKRGESWIGYKIHITETVDGEDANFITDMHATPADVNDSQALEDIQDNLDERDVTPDEQYVDQGYMSGEHIDESAERGIDLRGRVSASSSTKPVGFRLCDFDIDVEQQLARCPAGNSSVRWSEVTGTKGVAFRAFLGKQCRACPFFREGACTTVASGRRLDISRHHMALQRRRQEQKTPEFKQEMKKRAAVEGTISEAVRAHGLRRNRHRGLAKTQFQAYFTGVAINLKRLMAVYPSLLSSFSSFPSSESFWGQICFSTESHASSLR